MYIIRLSYAISWTNIDTERKNTLQTFLESTNGLESFNWQPPDMSVSKLWVNEFPTIVPVAADIWNVSVVLNQVFDL